MFVYLAIAFCHVVHEIGGHAEVIADIVAVSPIGFLCLAQLCFELFDTTRVGAQFPADEQTDNNSREEATCYYNPGHSEVLGLRGSAGSRSGG